MASLRGVYDSSLYLENIEKINESLRSTKETNRTKSIHIFISTEIEISQKDKAKPVEVYWIRRWSVKEKQVP